MERNLHDLVYQHVVTIGIEGSCRIVARNSRDSPPRRQGEPIQIDRDSWGASCRVDR